MRRILRGLPRRSNLAGALHVRPRAELLERGQRGAAGAVIVARGFGQPQLHACRVEDAVLATKVTRRGPKRVGPFTVNRVTGKQAQLVRRGAVERPSDAELGLGSAAGDIGLEAVGHAPQGSHGGHRGR